jgi:hypothetical protein
MILFSMSKLIYKRGSTTTCMKKQANLFTRMINFGGVNTVIYEFLEPTFFHVRVIKIQYNNQSEQTVIYEFVEPTFFL